MFRTWRRAAAVALAAGAAIAAQLTLIAPAQAAATTTPTRAITIFATSHFKPLGNDVFVIYGNGITSRTATIHGKITGAAAGQVAALYAQQFPYKTRPVRLGSKTLKAAAQTYSFTVTPVLATRYSVRLFPAGKSPVTLAISRTQNLYVAPGGFFNGGRTCSVPVCHETFHVTTVVPASALRLEMSKHFYPYFGLTLGTTRAPPPPKWLYLNAGHPSRTRARELSATTFVFTISFSFTIGAHSYSWAWKGCAQDSLASDGVGLPGRHDCGVSRVARTAPYLG